jgi:ribonuclease VapC
VIVVDTSALVEIVLDGPEAEWARRILANSEVAAISAGTLAETSIVAAGRGVGAEMTQLLDRLTLDVVPVTGSEARRVADAYARWGKGVHPARLNFGDCFAYALAHRLGCPLLFVGQDFARTDITACLAQP